MSLKERNPDSELVEKLQLGDIEAFDQIFKKYGGKLYGFALKYLKSKEDTEGLVQDVFLKIWENRKKIKKEASLKAYLFTIAYHDMCRIFKKRQINLKIISKNKAVANQSFDLEKQLDYKFALNEIDLLIERLPKKQRIIFIKSRREGKSTNEIAKELKLAPGTVDNNISASLKFLRKLITAENFGIILFFMFLCKRNFCVFFHVESISSFF